MKMMDCAKFVLLSTTFFFIKGTSERVAPHHPASAAESVAEALSDFIATIEAENAIDAVADFVELIKAENVAEDSINSINDEENTDNDNTPKVLINSEENDVEPLRGMLQVAT